MLCYVKLNDSALKQLKAPVVEKNMNENQLHVECRLQNLKKECLSVDKVVFLPKTF